MSVALLITSCPVKLGSGFCQVHSAVNAIWGLSFGDTRFTLDTRGLGQPFPPQSPSSKRGTGLESWESILQSCYPVFCLSGPFFLWPLRMYRILWKSRRRSLALRQEPTTKARECWCQFSLCVRICTLFLPNESTTNQPCTKNPTDKSFWYLE